MVARVRCCAGTHPRDVTGLRLLIELPAVRKLADRGLSDQELAVARKLANATLRAALRGDVPGYRQADMVFHLHLLELTGDPALAGVARVLLAGDRGHAPRAGEPGRPMAAGAREHCELVSMLAGDLVNAADDLLRHHISRQWLGRPGPGSPDRNPPGVREA
jgi:DNA-binding GntR family transcriptional regulator